MMAAEAMKIRPNQSAHNAHTTRRCFALFALRADAALRRGYALRASRGARASSSEYTFCQSSGGGTLDTILLAQRRASATFRACYYQHHK